MKKKGRNPNFARRLGCGTNEGYHLLIWYCIHKYDLTRLSFPFICEHIHLILFYFKRIVVYVYRRACYEHIKASGCGERA